MSSAQLSDDTSVRVDDQGFIYFEIDDGEDDAPFECGEIGLGYVIDAMEEVLAAKNEEDKTFTVENYPLVEVTLIDNDFYLMNNDDDNFWEIVADKNKFLDTLKSLVAEE
jgi:hypothetical protein